MKRDTEAYRLMENMASELKKGYYSTQTTSFSLYAIARYIGQNAGKGIAFDYMVNKGKNETVKTGKSIHTYDLNESAGISGNIQVRNSNTESMLFVNVTLTGQPLPGDETTISSNLKLRVVYREDDGNVLDVASIRQGTDFYAEVTIEHPGLLFDYSNLALNHVFPSGWEIINTRVQDISSGLKEDVFDYRDIRDDRVFTFFNLDRNSKKTFRVRLNAAYTGKYYLPAVNCEAMYEKNIHANTKGSWVEVVR